MENDELATFRRVSLRNIVDLAVKDTVMRESFRIYFSLYIPKATFFSRVSTNIISRLRINLI